MGVAHCQVKIIIKKVYLEIVYIDNYVNILLCNRGK